MANDGRILGRPPVPLPQGASRQHLFGLVRGVSAFSMGAGGFAKVIAFPKLQQLTQPANPHRTPEQRMVELYGSAPATFKQRLERQFTAGHRPPGR
jgi:hypothetical protein